VPAEAFPIVRRKSAHSTHRPTGCHPKQKGQRGGQSRAGQSSRTHALADFVDAVPLLGFEGRDLEARPLEGASHQAPHRVSLPIWPPKASKGLTAQEERAVVRQSRRELDGVGFAIAQVHHGRLRRREVRPPDPKTSPADAEADPEPHQTRRVGLGTFSGIGNDLGRGRSD
jgi:hypothetical protein